MHSPILSPEAPWKKRFRADAIFRSAIAPLSPMHGIAASNRSGTVQWYAWDVPSGNLRQITNTPGGHANPLLLAPDARFVYYLEDEHGNELGHFVRMPYAGGELEDLTPDLPSYSSFKMALSRNGQQFGFIGSYEDHSSIYTVENSADGKPGEPRLLYESANDISDVRLTSDGAVVIFTSNDRTSTTEYDLIAIAVHTGEQIAILSDGKGASMGVGPSSPILGDGRFLATTTRTGIERLVIWDTCAQTRVDYEMPEIAGAIQPLDWTPNGERILFAAIHQAETSLYWLNLPQGTVQPLNFGSGVVDPVYVTPDGSEIFAHWQDASSPSQLVALDPETGTIQHTILAKSQIPPGRPWQSISFPSSDEQLIHAWLSVPDGSGPFPTVLHTHGGPTAVQRNVFSPGAQAWLDHGFAYCSVNYRGSTTFGYEFEQKINGHLGDWELEDMVAARHFLVGQGVALPDAILLTGASYGGYLTLLGLGRRPELWAGGIALIAIADWTAMYADAAEMLRGYQRALFGGTPEETPEQHRISSPITYAENVRVPVLVIQGRNDMRTPARQLELYEQRLRELGKEIEVHWFDTGHAGPFADVEAAISNMERMLHFAHGLVASK